MHLLNQVPRCSYYHNSGNFYNNSDLANPPSLQGSPSLPDPETKSNKKNGIYIHYILVIYV